MARLGANEIYAAARAGGFSPSQAVTMTAIALAESGGNTDAHNPRGEDSRGLWQINLDAHAAKFRGWDLNDPVQNARAAYVVSGNGANISPWTVTHQSKGALYLRHRQAAESAAQSAGEPAQGNWSASRGYGTTTSAGASTGEVWQGATPTSSGNVGVSGTQYGGATGTVSTSSATGAPTDTRTPEQYAMEEFGQFAAFLQHPELGPILSRAATEKWSDAILEAEIHKTQWWLSTNERMRQWDALQGSDPNQATSQINGQAASVMARANQLGMPISPERARVIAENSLRFGWQGAELDNAIGGDAGQQQLLTSTFGRGLTTTARQYGIPMSEQTISSWAQRIASGQDTIENFNSEMVRKATNMYPEAQAHLENGGTIDEFYDPYREVAAKTLGINPAEIDFMDPKWGSALAVADETGKRRPMTMDQWQQQLKQTPVYGYAKTQAAVDEAATLVGNMKRSWGM